MGRETATVLNDRFGRSASAEESRRAAQVAPHRFERGPRGMFAASPLVCKRRSPDRLQGQVTKIDQKTVPRQSTGVEHGW